MARPHANQVRIIGGRWRGRHLTFPDRPGLRPTPDRVRETLFNWLGQRLDDLSCLDLFAGSGALGFEAASRGAATVVMIENDRQAITRLRANLVTLAAPGVRIIEAEALSWLEASPTRFDLIFLDPPFSSDLLPRALQLAGQHLNPAGRIYAEFGAAPDLSAWRMVREGRAGDTRQALLALPDFLP